MGNPDMGKMKNTKVLGDAENDRREQLFFEAVDEDSADKIRILLEDGPYVPGRMGKRKRSVFQHALIGSCEKAALAMIEAGAAAGFEVNPPPNARHPLFLTTSPVLVKALIDAGSDPNAVWENVSPLAFLCSVADLETLRYLLEQGARPDYGFQSALAIRVSKLRESWHGWDRELAGCLDLFALALTKGMDLNAPGPGDIMLALGAAAEGGTASLVRGILALGADPKSKDALGRTALHLAYRPKIARILLEAGGDPNAKDSKGRTPLHVVSYRLHRYCYEASKVLLNGGANPHVLDDEGSVAVGRTWRKELLVHFAKVEKKALAKAAANQKRAKKRKPRGWI